MKIWRFTRKPVRSNENEKEGTEMLAGHSHLMLYSYSLSVSLPSVRIGRLPACDIF